jgi:hypothetical protein
LKWTTATEVNNYGFEIERKQIPLNPPLQGGSRAVGEAGGFSKVGFVSGSGTTNSPHEYSFTDRNLTVGQTSYRLKQIDRDGVFKYSQSVEVEVGVVPRVFELSQNYPNPFNPSTIIRFKIKDSRFVSLKVYDVLGREVASLVNEFKKAGKYEIRFTNNQLPSGLYLVKMVADNFTATRKIILLK